METPIHVHGYLNGTCPAEWIIEIQMGNIETRTSRTVRKVCSSKREYCEDLIRWEPTYQPKPGSICLDPELLFSCDVKESHPGVEINPHQCWDLQITDLPSEVHLSCWYYLPDEHRTISIGWVYLNRSAAERDLDRIQSF